MKVIKIPEALTAKPPLNPSTIRPLGGLMVYSDASWKVDNTYAGFFVLFCNGAIDWAAKLLKVQMSSTEAEIAAGSIAGKRVIYIRGFIGCIVAFPKIPVSHIIDNSALPALTENMGVSKKSEHFRRWQHFLRYLVTHGYSYIHLVRTYEMHANALTKVDNKDAFFKFCKIAMNY